MDDLFDEKEATIIKSLLARKLNFDLSTYDDKFLGRRVKKRMQTVSISEVEKYCEYVIANDHEKEELVHDLAINVTNFMRDKTPFDLFKNEIIPKILQNKHLGDEISVWSAGCASGEEPYSIGILFFEALGRKIHDYNIKIMGTDMSDLAIRRSQAGDYDEIQFKDMDKTYVEKYFQPIGDNKYEIKSHVKNIVEFKKHNLLVEQPPRKFDCIFCRNTVIYFSKEGKEALFERIYESLNQGGFFIMGKTETLIGPAKDKFTTVNLSERIYTKQ